LLCLFLSPRHITKLFSTFDCNIALVTPFLLCRGLLFPSATNKLFTALTNKDGIGNYGGLLRRHGYVLGNCFVSFRFEVSDVLYYTSYARVYLFSSFNGNGITLRL
jgi:hypothetical protein